MVYQTSVSMFGVDDVRIRLLEAENSKAQTRVLTIGFPGGTELRFMGPKGRLLAMFRAVETSLLEDDPDADVFFGEDAEIDVDA
jgi:hypothetical protein